VVSLGPGHSVTALERGGGKGRTLLSPAHLGGDGTGEGSGSRLWVGGWSREQRLKEWKGERVGRLRDGVSWSPSPIWYAWKICWSSCRPAFAQGVSPEFFPRKKIRRGLLLSVAPPVAGAPVVPGNSFLGLPQAGMPPPWRA